MRLSFNNKKKRKKRKRRLAPSEATAHPDVHPAVPESSKDVQQRDRDNGKKTSSNIQPGGVLTPAALRMRRVTRV